MKNLLRFTLLILVGTVLLSSCKNVSVTKRKYNKGYYVSRSGKKHDVKKQEPSIAVNLVPKTETAQPEKSEPVNTDLKLPENPQPEIVDNTSPSSSPVVIDEKPAKTTSHKRNLKFPSFPSVQPNADKSVDGVSAGPEAGLISAALSLFWIVILIILIFYLVAILVGGFGLGWTIHLLAVVILILLILWLLGVV